jgi:epoxyqueuosine reductase QueG
MRRIAAAVTAFMADRRRNALFPGSDQPAFDQPILGHARGDDPLFSWIKNDIGPDFFWTPQQAYQAAFPEDAAQPEELSVIAWVLPQTAATRAAQARARELPSLEWTMARHHGEAVNEALRRFVVEHLAGRGIAAVAPVLLPQWGRALSTRYGFASSWSERHAAHVCALGCFGLSDGLITAAGKAVRVGSVVARMVLPPVVRPYDRHDAWCLRAVGVDCRACMKRCPAGAITEAGHDKAACKAYIRGVTGPFVAREQMGFAVSSCGLCQTGVPCEKTNPTAKRARRASRE